MKTKKISKKPKELEKIENNKFEKIQKRRRQKP